MVPIEFESCDTNLTRESIVEVKDEQENYEFIEKCKADNAVDVDKVAVEDFGYRLTHNMIVFIC